MARAYNLLEQTPISAFSKAASSIPAYTIDSSIDYKNVGECGNFNLGAFNYKVSALVFTPQKIIFNVMN